MSFLHRLAVLIVSAVLVLVLARMVTAPVQDLRVTTATASDPVLYEGEGG